MRILRSVLKLVFYIGLIVCGFYSVVLTVMTVLSISGRDLGDDIPKFPHANFFGMLLLLVVNWLITSFLFAGKSESFRKLALWTVYSVGLGSLGFIIVGIATNNRFTGDETNIGLVWLTMSVIFRVLILLKDMQVKQRWCFREQNTESKKKTSAATEAL